MIYTVLLTFGVVAGIVAILGLYSCRKKKKMDIPFEKRTNLPFWDDE